MYNSFFKLYIPIIIILICISLFILALLTNNLNSEIIFDLESEFFWPLPGNQNITSYFGKRNSPTAGASSYHSGLDIGAAENTPIYACFTGQVTYTGFKGAGGYTLTIKNNNIEASFCHISPNYLFKVGDIVNKQSIIAYVGPKNVYGIINNPYKDSSR